MGVVAQERESGEDLRLVAVGLRSQPDRRDRFRRSALQAVEELVELRAGDDPGEVGEEEQRRQGPLRLSAPAQNRARRPGRSGWSRTAASEGWWSRRVPSGSVIVTHRSSTATDGATETEVELGCAER